MLKQLSLIGVVVLVIILFAYNFSFFTNISIENIIATVESFGIFAPLLFMLLMITAIVIFPIPSLPFTIASGFLFGIFFGVIYSVTGALIGAGIAFIIAKTFGRERVKKRFSKLFSFVDSYPENRLFYLIFITRLFPLFNFGVMSYVFGVTKISFPKYMLATFIGMLPLSFAFVYFGNTISINPIMGGIVTVIFIIIFFLIPIIFSKLKS